MYRNENPMQYRRNAISITPQRMRTGSDERTSDDLIYVPDGKYSRQSRAMSVSDETSGLRVRNVLSRFSLNADEDGPSNSTSAALGSRITQAQIEAFKEVFDLFDSNGGGTIDAEELDLALRSVGICLSEIDIVGVLDSMDKDGNGEIDFNEFLNLMTNTEKFLEAFEDSSSCLETKNHSREIMLFEALTQFMKNSALHSMEEIVGYFHSKYKRAQAPHVVGHYAAGARLIGLTEKQLQKHMEKIRASNANSTSPYAQPLYNLEPSLAKRARIGGPPLSNCLRGKKGKIRLHFKVDDLKKKSLEAKDANQISGVKSAAELRDKLATDTVSKKPQQPIIKRNGWVSQKAQPVIVHLPTVPLTPKKRGRDGKRVPLTFDDLPAIRKKVEKAKESYYKQIHLKKKAEAQQHWETLGTDLITSPVCQERFHKVFKAYTAYPYTHGYTHYTIWL